MLCLTASLHAQATECWFQQLVRSVSPTPLGLLFLVSLLSCKCSYSSPCLSLPQPLIPVRSNFGRNDVLWWCTKCFDSVPQAFIFHSNLKIVYCFNHTNNIINLTCRCPLYPHALPNLIRSLIIFALDLFFFLLRKYNEASADSPIPSFYFLPRGDWPLARIHCWSSHSYFILPLHSCVFIGIKKCRSTGCYPISHV